MNVKYVGVMNGPFRTRGPLTKIVYKVPGKGGVFSCDPCDAHGAKGRKGFKHDAKNYEVPDGLA